MDAQQILNAVSMLAKSQGFYGRLLRDLLSDRDYLDYLAAQEFPDVLNMVLFLES